MSDKSLSLVVPVSQYPAYVFNKLASTGFYGATREEVFERMFDGWLYNFSFYKVLKNAKISQEDAKIQGYIPFRKLSDEEVKEERNKRLKVQDLSSRKYDLNLGLRGMQAYVVEKTPGSFVFPEVCSSEGLVRKIFSDWMSIKEEILRKKFKILRRGAVREKYLVR